MFMETEAEWVASWIEYLGDTETADKIRATPNEFKGIISARYEELSEFQSKFRQMKGGIVLLEEEVEVVNKRIKDLRR